MKYSLRHAMIIIVLSQLIFSCGSDEGDNLQVCRVQSMISYFADSITYEYSSNNKLNNVSYINRRNGEVNRKIILTYDGKERLSKVTDENFFGDTRNYELTYDNQDRPATSSNWVGQPTSPFITTFSYDDKSRLVKRVAGQSGYQFISRYTYDDNDNVAEVYYTNPAVSETLGLRYLSYDTKDRIYAGSKDAEILSVYIYGWDPGRTMPYVPKL